MTTHHPETITTVLRTAILVGSTRVPESPETTLLLPEIIPHGSTAPAPVKSMAAPCLGVTVIATATVEEPRASPGAIQNVPVQAPIGNLTMVVTVTTRAAPLPQGPPRLPMGVAVEAVAMTTMEAVPGTAAMAVATVTPAVGVRLPTPLAVASALAGRSGGPPPRSREATLLVTGTAARDAEQAAERPAVVAAAAASIEGWPAAVTETKMDWIIN